MTDIVTFDSKPDLKAPVLIEGLPGVGNVGKIAADFLSVKLGAERFARVLSEHLPPQIMIDEDCVGVMACCELWFAKDVNGHDIVFLLGDYQSPTANGQFLLSQTILDIVMPYSPCRIITLCGYGTGESVPDPRVLGVVSNPELKPEFESYGVSFVPDEPRGGIIGAAAVLLGLGKERGVDSVSLIGETCGYVLDGSSASKLVGILAMMLGIAVDTSELLWKPEQQEAPQELSGSDDRGKDYLPYIG